jgi:hypothetical protein
LTTKLRIGKTTLPAGTKIFRTENKRSLLYRTPGMPAGQYLGVSRRAFGKALARVLATSNKGKPAAERSSATDVVKDIPTGRRRWHDNQDPVRLSNRQVKGVENLSRMFGLPDSTHHDRVPTGLKQRMTKTTTMGDTKFHEDGRISGMDLSASTVRQFSTKPAALEVATWTSQSFYRGNRRKQRGIDTSTTWLSDGVRVNYRFDVGRRHGKKRGALKKLAKALGLKVQAGDRLDFSVARAATGAMTLRVNLTERGKEDPIQRSYRVSQQSRGTLFDPIE